MNDGETQNIANPDGRCRSPFPTEDTAVQCLREGLKRRKRDPEASAKAAESRRVHKQNVLTDLDKVSANINDAVAQLDVIGEALGYVVRDMLMQSRTSPTDTQAVAVPVKASAQQFLSKWGV